MCWRRTRWAPTAAAGTSPCHNANTPCVAVAGSETLWIAQVLAKLQVKGVIDV